jgi:hypothetical protein
LRTTSSLRDSVILSVVVICAIPFGFEFSCDARK